MNNLLKIIFFLLTMAMVGCGQEPHKESHREPDVEIGTTQDPSPSLEPPKTDLRFDPDAKNFRDNFDYRQFDGIDWRNPNTFGAPCSGMCVGPTNDPIPEHAGLSELGITNDNYSMVTIKGDGSCWIRSAIQAVLFPAFQDQAVFNGLIDNIKEASTSLAVVPGFSARFRGEDLINLLTTLNALSPKERLAKFNKTKVDLFLDYSMRGYMHAKEVIRWEKYPDDETYAAIKEINQENQIKLLTSHSWGSTMEANTELSLLLPKNFLFAYLWDFDFKNPRSGNLKLSFSGSTDLNVLFSAQVARTYGEEFRNDRRSLVELKNELVIQQQNLEAKRPILAQLEHPEFEAVKSLASRISPLRLQIVYKEIENSSGIRSMADFHQLPSFRIFSYRQYEGHASVMVHKNARAAFGYD